MIWGISARTLPLSRKNYQFFSKILNQIGGDFFTFFGSINYREIVNIEQQNQALRLPN